MRDCRRREAIVFRTIGVDVSHRRPRLRLGQLVTHPPAPCQRPRRPTARLATVHPPPRVRAAVTRPCLEPARNHPIDSRGRNRRRARGSTAWLRSAGRSGPATVPSTWTTPPISSVD